MNKKAWVKIVEAFFAILLIATALMTIIQTEKIKKTEDSSNIYNEESAILSDIELNQTLRNEILGVESLSVNLNDSSFPDKVKTKIQEKIPSYLQCKARICWINESCDLYFNEAGKSIYAKSVIISSNLTKYSPRQIKLFCWVI